MLILKIEAYLKVVNITNINITPTIAKGLKIDTNNRFQLNIITVGAIALSRINR